MSGKRKSKMPYQLQHLLRDSAQRSPESTALLFKDQVFDYAGLWGLVRQFAGGLEGLGLPAGERVAVYLPKQPETVISLFGAATAGGVFVPVNPVLKPEQAGYILRHCGVRILLTSAARAATLADELRDCPALQTLVLVDEPKAELQVPQAQVSFASLVDAGLYEYPHGIDADVVSILYTSGSTGQPKGVVLSHANMLAGAFSVSTYLRNTSDDRLLAVLPLSFDYGLSQLTTAFAVGASVVLMDYLLPRDVIRAVARYQVSGLAAVPPLWNQLAPLPWPEEAVNCLRYITNSGGAMPLATLSSLRESLSQTQVFLMYGLTEAFRSTYLEPDQLDTHPTSMGKAIPNAEVMVVRADGSECGVDEVGELVHRGALVSLGYWNDVEKTCERFKPAPGQPTQLPQTEMAVWSGDRVRRDAEGFLYFVGRNDEMIKTSGYRVSPGEIEEAVLVMDAVEQAVAFGVPHPMLGQGIVLVAKADCTSGEVLAHCNVHLPQYMLPGRIEVLDELPRNANGKIDRKSLSNTYQASFDN